MLARVVKEWHANKVEALNTVINAPAGTELVFQCADGSEIRIDGNSDKAKGFRIGCIIALEQFGKLPFSFELREPGDDVDDDE